MFDIEILGALGVGYFIGLACVGILLPLFKHTYLISGQRKLFRDLWRWDPKAAQEFRDWYVSNTTFSNNGSE